MYLQPIITICGSLKDWDNGLIQANAMLVVKNIIGLPSGFSMKYPEKFPVVADYVSKETEKMKKIFDSLHFQKIMLSNGIWVTNIGDYIGDSTKREILFADKIGKTVFTFEKCSFCEENDIEYYIVPLNVESNFPDWFYNQINEVIDCDTIEVYEEFCGKVDGK